MDKTVGRNEVADVNADAEQVRIFRRSVLQKASAVFWAEPSVNVEGGVR